jgi:hypothetical protein
LELVVKNNLVDQFKQTWTSKIENSSRMFLHAKEACKILDELSQ